MGKPLPLYGELCKLSWLPGKGEANLHLAQTFGEVCASHGQRADRLIEQMARLDVDQAPGATELEYLPVCGVYAAGARAASDPRARGKMLSVMHDAAEDMRFRVRDAVPTALARVGARLGDALVAEVDSWMDGYFQAAAVLRALVRPEWLTAAHDADAVTALFAKAFALLDDAPRSAVRYPGHKALVEAMREAPGPIALRFGAPVFDALASFAKSKDPHLRELIVEATKKAKLDARHPEEVKRVLAAFSATAKPVRDPRSLPGPTRRRGGGHRR
jgi:hypothetical protein